MQCILRQSQQLFCSFGCLLPQPQSFQQIISIYRRTALRQTPHQIAQPTVSYVLQLRICKRHDDNPVSNTSASPFLSSASPTLPFYNPCITMPLPLIFQFSPLSYSWLSSVVQRFGGGAIFSDFQHSYTMSHKNVRRKARQGIGAGIMGSWMDEGSFGFSESAVMRGNLMMMMMTASRGGFCVCTSSVHN